MSDKAMNVYDDGNIPDVDLPGGEDSVEKESVKNFESGQNLPVTKEKMLVQKRGNRDICHSAFFNARLASISLKTTKSAARISSCF